MEWALAGVVFLALALMAPLWSWTWRDMRRRGGGGDAFLELNKIIEPSHHHIETSRDAKPQAVRDGDPPLPVTRSR